ncbi:MAG: rod shape-determining protein [Patescibacteria group bacterium]|jgi:rod shape-determining protein MreB
MINSLQMFDKILRKISYDIGIDLGTSNVLVYVRGKGILIREPSVITIHRKTKNVVAVGDEAKKMLGKTPPSLIAVRPLRGGVIADFYCAQQMLIHFIETVHSMPSKFPKLPRPRVVIGIPSGITSVEKKAVIDASKRAGARETFLIDEPMAAAIGAGLDVSKPRGNIIVDMGGGTTEIAVISLFGIVVSRSLKTAGDRLDQEIVKYARDKYNLLLGEKTAEQVKCKFGSTFEFKDEKSITAILAGRDLKTGLPRSVEVSPAEIRNALRAPVYEIIGAVKDTIEDTPAELMPDILKNGIVLAGGTSLLKGFSQLMEQEIKVPVRVAEDPITCVVRGCARVLESDFLLEKITS